MFWRFLYYIIQLLLQFFMQIAAFFSPKAKLWVSGRKKLPPYIADAPSVWIHCASVGEFEQARPLIEQLKKEHPAYRIVLTFFSPSGYTLRKNYPLADLVSYLPLDTPANAEQWLSYIRPALAIFVKYEIWFNFSEALAKNSIPFLLISAKFLPNQIYFKPHGKLLRQALRQFSYVVVQDQISVELMQQIGVAEEKIVQGKDTRFDTVWKNKQQSCDYTFVEKFKNNELLLVAGSTWQEDEDMLYKLLKTFPHFKCLLVPHEIYPETIKKLQLKMAEFNSIRYSEITTETPLQSARVLVLDAVGMLSKIYRYGEIAYVGGGFGKGIHNILEAAVYELPVVFGPKFARFKEAVDMIGLEAAFSCSDFSDLENIMAKLLQADKRNEAGHKAKQYIVQNLGGTQQVMELVEPLLKMEK